MSFDIYAGHCDGDCWGPIGGDWDQSLNLANGNARMVFEALGLEIDEGAEFEIGLVQKACVVWMDGQGDTLSRGRATVETQRPGLRVIECGTPDGYLDARIERILQIAESGARLGATHLIVV